MKCFLEGENQSTHRETYTSAGHSVYHISKQAALDLNLHFHDDKLVSNSLSYGTDNSSHYFQHYFREYDIGHVGYLSCKNDQAQNKFENHQSKHQKLYTHV